MYERLKSRATYLPQPEARLANLPGIMGSIFLAIRSRKTALSYGGLPCHDAWIGSFPL